ncbi:hypothetical protein PG991_013111 [Apiospora marii]|uniref:2EXR domain-containing protein n=1 Tax=Apiospora marii TaxID=335849 RepID=A0ABR1R584_9PEZI
MVRSADEFCCLYQAGDCEYNLARSRSLTNMASADFPQFSKLPPEIRNAIWREAALEASGKRLLILGSSHQHMYSHWNSSRKSIHVSPQMRQSALFLVSRESRRAARHIYDVSLHVYSMSKDSNGYCISHAFSDGCEVIYKGEVYISLVHDVFVELDDSEALEVEPDLIFDGFQGWDSYPLTGRLRTDQTSSIKRLMVIHWLLDLEADCLSDQSDQSDHSIEESQPDENPLIEGFFLNHLPY